jgi:lipopolysaccharide export system protein LptA
MAVKITLAQKRERIFLGILCACCALLAPRLSAGANSGLITKDSTVGSDRFKMDLTNNLEILTGHVSFRNSLYDLRADHAIHDKNAQVWKVRGSVYCLRKFIDGSNIEVYGDNGQYFESAEKAELYRGAELIKIKHVSAAGKILNGRCDRVNADNAKATMDFLGNFYLNTENMEIFSDNGLYNDAEHSFLIYNSTPAALSDKGAGKIKSTPVAVGVRDGHDFAMTGETMRFFKDTGDVKLYNNVAGWVKAVQKN